MFNRIDSIASGILERNILEGSIDAFDRLARFGNRGPFGHLQFEENVVGRYVGEENESNEPHRYKGDGKQQGGDEEGERKPAERERFIENWHVDFLDEALQSVGKTTLHAREPVQLFPSFLAAHVAEGEVVGEYQLALHQREYESWYYDDGYIVHKLAYHAWEKKDGEKGDRSGDDCEGDGHGNQRGATGGALYSWTARLELCKNAFANHDGVVDDDSQNEDEGEEREQIDGDSERGSDGDCREKTDRDSDGDEEGERGTQEYG